MKIILYTNNCPKCEILQKKLTEKKIEYDIFSDVEEMLNKGIDTVPLLEVDGNIMSFKQAVNWINKEGN